MDPLPRSLQVYYAARAFLRRRRGQSPTGSPGVPLQPPGLPLFDADGGGGEGPSGGLDPSQGASSPPTISPGTFANLLAMAAVGSGMAVGVDSRAVTGASATAAVAT